MAWPLWPKSRVEYYNTPQGILTESGVWYRTTVDLLNEYAGELFERESLGLHLARSDTWIRSPHTLSIWLLALGIMYYQPWQLIVAIPLFFLLWQIVGPALVNRTITSIMRFMDAVILQAALYAGTMSILAMSGQYESVLIGLVGFICLRWGILTYLTRPVVVRCWEVMYKLPAPDHILRAFMIRSALRHGINLAGFEEIEKNVINNVFKKSPQKGKS